MFQQSLGLLRKDLEMIIPRKGHPFMERLQDRGFTLIELLIVIVILGLLYSLVAPAMFSKVDSTKVKTAQIQLEMLRTSMEAFRLDMGDYPEALSQL